MPDWFFRVLEQQSTANSHGNMGSFIRSDSGKSSKLAVIGGDKEPGLFVTTIPLGDESSGDFECARPSLLDSRGKVVKATMTWW